MELKTADVRHGRRQSNGCPGDPMSQKPRRQKAAVTSFAVPWSPLDVATLTPPNSGGIRLAFSSLPLVPHLAQRLAIWFTRAGPPLNPPHFINGQPEGKLGVGGL